MIPLALEALQAGIVRGPRRRKIASCHNAEWRGRSTAFIGFYRPYICLAIEGRLFDPGVELDVASEVEPISDMVDVAQDLGLRAVTLGPAPFLLQFVGKRI